MMEEGFAITSKERIRKNFGFIQMSYSVFLVVLTLLVFFSIALLKSKTIVEFSKGHLFFLYTIFVTTFAFSRIMSAVLYKYSYLKFINEEEKDLNEKPYEPKITFIVPCKNEEKVIASTVEKCFEVKYPKRKVEVIVINDGSTDNTLGILKGIKRKYRRLKLIGWQVNQGKRIAMTAGIRRAKGEIIVQLDSDSFIDADSFRNLILPFKNAEIGAVCAHAEPANAKQNLLTRMQAAYYFISFRILKAAESTFGTVFCCSGCSSAYRKSVILPALDNWINETFLGKRATWGDDRALTSYVLKSGYKAIYTDRVQAYTYVPTTLKHLLKQQIRWKKSWVVNSFFTGRFIYKKQPFVAFFYFFPLVILSMITPIISFRAIIYDPIVRGIIPIYYVSGVLLLTCLILICCRIVDNRNRYWPYFFLWAAFNMVLLAYLMFYSILTLQNRKWGTR